MTEITVYGLGDASRGDLIVRTVNRNGEILEDPQPEDNLTCLVQLYADKNRYAFDAEITSVAPDLPGNGDGLSKYYNDIDSLVEGAKEYMDKLSDNSYGLRIKPVFWTPSEDSFQFTNGERYYLTVLWGLFAPIKVKRKAWAILRGTIRGLNEEEREMFERIDSLGGSL